MRRIRDALEMTLEGKLGEKKEARNIQVTGWFGYRDSGAGEYLVQQMLDIDDVWRSISIDKSIFTDATIPPAAWIYLPMIYR